MRYQPDFLKGINPRQREKRKAKRNSNQVNAYATCMGYGQNEKNPTGPAPWKENLNRLAVHGDFE